MILSNRSITNLFLFSLKSLLFLSRFSFTILLNFELQLIFNHSASKHEAIMKNGKNEGDQSKATQRNSTKLEMVVNGLFVDELL